MGAIATDLSLATPVVRRLPRSSTTPLTPKVAMGAVLDLAPEAGFRSLALHVAFKERTVVPPFFGQSRVEFYAATESRHSEVLGCQSTGFWLPILLKFSTSAGPKGS